MGLIRAFAGAVSGNLADQWKEYFSSDSLDSDTLVVKGRHNSGRRSSNTKGTDNVITSGSTVIVADGQCMLIVDQGKVAELCAEPGVYLYKPETSPSIFSGKLSKGILDSFRDMGARFTYGGEPARDQRVYYVNTKEIVGNKYGTANPVPFRVVDKNIGLDVDIAIKCFGEYSIKIVDPILFYTHVTGNVEEPYTRDKLDSQLRTELLTALQPAFAKISAMGIRYSALPGHTEKLAGILNDELSAKWRDLRGIEIVSFGVSSVTASEEDEKMIKEVQRNAVFRSPTMAAAHLVGSTGSAMQSAAANQGAGGPMGAFIGMGMARDAAGGSIQNLYSMGAGEKERQPRQQEEGWTCPACGQQGNTGKFCTNCGAKKPDEPGTWKCPKCGTSNTGKFCSNCGAKKPEASGAWKCPKCGTDNTGKFCTNCGTAKPEGAS